MLKKGNRFAVLFGLITISLYISTDALAEDEDDVLLLYSREKPTDTPLKRFNFSLEIRTDQDRESDVEGAARIDNRIYWITSHGRNSKGKMRANRYRLFATDISNESPDELELAWVGSYNTLIQDALDKASWEHPNENETDTTIHFLSEASQLGEKKAARLAPKKNGLNIEALAALPDHKGLLIGFRNPLSHAKALVIHLKNPEDVVTNKDVKPVFGQPRYLDLGGLGLRSMAYNAVRKKILIVAGEKASGGSFKLFEWDFNKKPPPVFIRDLHSSKGSHPEALFIHGSQIHILQ
jgi:hypothetical protein